jgi:hypothetical protein
MMIMLHDNDADYFLEFYLMDYETSLEGPPWNFTSGDGKPAEEIWGMLMKAFPKHHGLPDTLCASQLLMLNQNTRKEYKHQYGTCYVEDSRRYYKESLNE